MTSLNLKKILLGGTALVAVGAFASGAQAADLTAAGSATWAGSAGKDSTSVANAVAADNLDITGDGVDILVTNDTSADDNSANTNTFALGTITDSSSATDGDLNITTGTTAGLTVTIVDATLDGNVVITGDAADDADIDVTVADDLTVGLALTLTSDADAANTVTLTVTDDLSVGNVATITSADGTGTDGVSTLIVGGDATFTGGLVLDDSAGGAESVFELNGATAQAISGAIDGDATGDGQINITGVGATFSGDIGAVQDIDQISLSNEGTGSSVTFQGDVGVDNTSGIVLGDGAGNADTYTATFDSSNGSITVDGTVQGAATDTSAVVISGGNSVVQADAWGGVTPLDSVTISGSSTLDSGAALTATTITIGTGSTLEVNATVSGDVAGTGTVDVDTGASIIGSVGTTSSTLSSIAIAEGQTLTVDAAGGDESIAASTILLEDAASDGSDAGLTIDATANTVTVTGNVTTGIDGEGVITLNDGTGAGTVAFVGDIGTSSVAVGLLTSTGAGSDETVTTTGNLYVDAITLDDADVLQFVGTSAQVVSGTIDGIGANDGVITVGDGTTTSDVTFNGIIGGTAVGALNVSENAAATFAANATIGTSAIDNDGTITINSGVTLAGGGAYTADAAAGTFNLGVKRTAGTTSIGTFDITAGGAVDLSNDTINFVVEDGSQPLTAETIASVIGGNGGGATTAGTITDNSFLYDFALVANGNDFDVTISAANTITGSATNSANANAGNMLITTLGTSTNTEINRLQSSLQSKSTQAALNDALEATVSDVAGGAVQSGVSVASRTSAITSTRLAALRDGSTVSGMSAGDLTSGVKVWAQGYGQTAQQDERDGVSGYQADTYGFVAGIDTEAMAENLTVGLAFAYADTEVDSDASDDANTAIDTIQVSFYGDYDLSDHSYISGQIGYMYADNETVRRNVGSVSGLNSSGDFESDAFLASAEYGYDFAVDHGITLTPKAGVNYVHYSADSYTETGAGGASLTVTSDDMDILEFGVGVDATTTHAFRDGSSIKPSLSAGVRYDVIGDEFQATNQFAGGGAAFKVEGFDPAQTTFDLGAGVTYYSTDNWEFSAGYDFEYKSDYDSHTGSVKAAYKF